MAGMNDGSPKRIRMSRAQRREQLIGIARELFGSRGYDAVSIEEIASAAEVSKPVVYEHFGGKEGLYQVIVDRGQALRAFRMMHPHVMQHAIPVSNEGSRRHLSFSLYVKQNSGTLRCHQQRLDHCIIN